MNGRKILYIIALHKKSSRWGGFHMGMSKRCCVYRLPRHRGIIIPY